MAKLVATRPEWLSSLEIHDIYSLSSCISDDFGDYTDFWKHNGYWLFDSPRAIREVATVNAIDLTGTALFFYEIYGQEFDDGAWFDFSPVKGLDIHVIRPKAKQLRGFDIVSFSAGQRPECSPLSCNSLAEQIQVNQHCLLASFDEAYKALADGKFERCEPGPYRIFSVYSVEWPKVESNSAG